MFLQINGEPTRFQPGDQLVYEHRHNLISAGRGKPGSDGDTRLKWRAYNDNKCLLNALESLPRDVACRAIQDLFFAFTGLQLERIPTSQSWLDRFEVIGSPLQLREIEGGT